MFNPIDVINKITSPYKNITRITKQSDVRTLKIKSSLFWGDLERRFISLDDKFVSFVPENVFNQGMLIAYFALKNESENTIKALKQASYMLEKPLKLLDLASLRFGAHCSIKYAKENSVRLKGIEFLTNLENQSYAMLGAKNSHPRVAFSNLVTYEVNRKLIKQNLSLKPHFRSVYMLLPKVLWKEDWEEYLEILLNFQILLTIDPKNKHYIKGINRIWDMVKNSGNSFYTFLYYAATRNEVKELEIAKTGLHEFSYPESKAIIEVKNKEEKKKYLFNLVGPKIITQPLPHWQRPSVDFTWSTDPYVTEGHLGKPVIATEYYPALDFLVARELAIQLDLITEED